MLDSVFLPSLPMLLLTQLSPDHARDAARLHIAGQPGTFLTSLGPDVLTVIYQALSQSPVGFGFAAMVKGAPAVGADTMTMAGYISATNSIGRLFVEILMNDTVRFLKLPCLARRG